MDGVSPASLSASLVHYPSMVVQSSLLTKSLNQPGLSTQHGLGLLIMSVIRPASSIGYAWYCVAQPLTLRQDILMVITHSSVVLVSFEQFGRPKIGLWVFQACPVFLVTLLCQEYPIPQFSVPMAQPSYQATQSNSIRES